MLQPVRSLYTALLLCLLACRPTEAPSAVPAPPDDEPLPTAPAPRPRTSTPPTGHPSQVRRGFPSSTPSLGGYALTQIYDAPIWLVPSALVWPRGEGAPALLLDRGGQVLELGPGPAREVLDITALVAFRSEGGALGLALHPQFSDGSPFAYLWYNARGTPRNKQRLSRFTWSTTTRSFDRASEFVLLEQDEEAAEHNAGHIQFGPDGFLYFGNGDDLDATNYQRLDRALFAGLFRIDVDSRGGSVSHAPPRQPVRGRSQGYFIPNDNPFVGVPNAMEEFFALGLRNPYGFSFDRQTGELWVADVGATFREEIDLVTRGGNYEWPYREGDVVRGTVVPTIGLTQPPTFTFPHWEMGDLTAVLGGFVYRGAELPELQGKYIFSDWPSCRVWALELSGGNVKRSTLIDDAQCQPTAWAEDERGELYLLSVEGISRLTRDPSHEVVPSLLSQTPLFSDLSTLTPAKELVPFEVNAALWSDGARKQRWIALPEGAQVEAAADGAFTFPLGTVFVKQFDLSERRMETRVLVVGAEDTYGLTYRWNTAGTDAELVREATDEGSTWHFPSFGQCWSCHRAENRVLGFNAAQLALTTASGRPQLEVLAERGVFSQAAIASLPGGLARPGDPTASLEERANAYLAANCSSCHHAGASFQGGEETWNALPGTPLAQRGLVRAPHHNGPVATRLGMPRAPLIDPGNPGGSLLLARMKSTDPDLRMPPLGRNLVDVEGVQLIEAWIRSMTP